MIPMTLYSSRPVYQHLLQLQSMFLLSTRESLGQGAVSYSHWCLYRREGSHCKAKCSGGSIYPLHSNLLSRKKNLGVYPEIRTVNYGYDVILTQAR